MSDSDDPRSPLRETSFRWFLPFLLVSLYGIWRIVLLHYRYFDTDELEHLHVAYCIAKGGILYKQFFEMHGPALYVFLTPLARLHDPLEALWGGRLLIFFLVCGIWIFQWHLAPADWSSWDRWVSVFFLLSFTSFAHHSLEIRPDVVASLLLSFLLIGGLRPLTPLMAFGAGMGAATGLLCSPKILFSLIGWGLVLTFNGTARRTRSTKFPWAPWVFLVSGAFLPLLICGLYFMKHHALGDFFGCFIRFNAHRRAGFPWWQIIGSDVKENPALWIFGLTGLALSDLSPALRLPLLTTLAGLVVSPSSASQSFLFVGPLLSCSAAAAIRRGRQMLEARSWLPTVWIPIGLAVLLAPSFALQGQSLRIGNQRQIERMRCIERMTGDSDGVFDVWSGESFFRPHVNYFWLLPDDVYAMFGPASMEKMLLSGLQNPRCRALLWDPRYFPKLSAAVQTYARDHYHASGCGVLYLRNALPYAL